MPTFTKNVKVGYPPKKKKLYNHRRSTGRFSPMRGLGQGVSTPHAPYRLYRGRPANPNSYFVDRTHPRLPQMDAWPGCRLGRTLLTTPGNGSTFVLSFIGMGT